jgi:hypothetical protein
MGIETAALIMAGVAVGAEVGKGVMEVNAANEREKSLDLEGKQMQIQSQQKALANYDVMEKVIDAQIAHQTTTGTAFSSPSFNAIQRNTLNIGEKKAKNLELEGDIAEENIEQEKRNVRTTLFAQLFGDVATSAESVASFTSKMPTMKE